jgi:hypothetical protein
MSGLRQKQWRKHVHLYGHALVDATGTHRRIQALAAIGWSTPALEQYAGVGYRKFHELLRKRRTHRNTAALVRRMYDELWNTPAPKGIGATRALTAARKNGWPKPAAWDDDEIDDPTATAYVSRTCKCGRFYDKHNVCYPCRQARNKASAA